MGSALQSRLLWVASLGSLALAAAISACSSGSAASPSAPVDSGNEGEGGGASSGSSSGAASSSSGAGSSSSGGSGSSSSGAASSSGGTGDGGEGGTSSGEAGADGGCATGTPITVHNFDSWCTVSLSGAATSVAPTYQACAPAGNAVGIVVGPASGSFEVGPSPFVRISGAEVPDASISTTGDGGAGSTSTAHVGIGTTPACVLVCCPFSNGTGCDSTFSGYSTFLTDCP